MDGPKEPGAYEGRGDDCRAAVMPLLKDFLEMQHGGVGDLRALEALILPAAQAAGWSKGDIALALRSKNPAPGSE
jgi:hypothetical protein